MSTNTRQEDKEFTYRLLELPHLLQNQSDFREVSRLITRQAIRLFHAQFAAVNMVNPTTFKTVKTIYQHSGNSAAEEQVDFLMLMMSGWVMEQETLLISDHLASDGRFQGIDAASAGDFGGVSIPLQYLNQLVGTITLLYENQGLPQYIQQERLETFGMLVSPYLSDTQKIQEYFTPPQSMPVLIRKYQSVGMIGQSTQYVQLLRDIEAATRSEVRVLLEGETGTGKELVAHAIHRFSKRKDRPFIPVDCGAIPANLVESELFGHVKGSFTHASNDRKGLIQSADGGVLFLDEIGNLSEEIQAKLLRVLQEGKVRPIGSNKIISVDVRVIVASSTPLQQLVAAGKFREDLFYRLYVYPIRVPSLQQRRTDIPVLGKHFLRKFAAKYTKKVQALDAALLEYMTNRQWNGNIRELENFIERLVTLAPSGLQELSTEHLPKRFQAELTRDENGTGSPYIRPLRRQLETYERDLIVQALETTDWKQVESAKILDIPESVLRYKMQKFEISK